MFYCTSRTGRRPSSKSVKSIVLCRFSDGTTSDHQIHLTDLPHSSVFKALEKSCFHSYFTWLGHFIRIHSASNPHWRLTPRDKTVRPTRTHAVEVAVKRIWTNARTPPNLPTPKHTPRISPVQEHKNMLTWVWSIGAFRQETHRLGPHNKSNPAYN